MANENFAAVSMPLRLRMKMNRQEANSVMMPGSKVAGSANAFEGYMGHTSPACIAGA